MRSKVNHVLDGRFIDRMTVDEGGYRISWNMISYLFKRISNLSTLIK